MTLVELVVAITLVGAAAAAMVSSFGWLTQQSSDPLVTRQATAVGEAMLAEVLAQGTGSTDPDGGAEGLGPESGEARGSTTLPFDHVNDYHGFDQTGVTALDGGAIAGLEAYRVRVSVRAATLGSGTPSQGWWVDVRVGMPGGGEVLLSGWKAAL